MKRIMGLILVSFLMYNSTDARDLYEKKLPSKFRQECFEFSSSYNFLKKDEAKYKVTINKPYSIAVKDGYLIPIIPYKILGSIYNYTSSSFTKLEYLSDKNQSTFVEIDTETSNEIVLNFTKKLPRNSFKMNFKHGAENYLPEIFISEDGKTFSAVSFSSMYDFDIKSLKINFAPRNTSAKREKIKIFELNFVKQESLNLMKVFGGGRIDFYSNYSCDDYINLNTIHVPFEIDVNTPTIKVDLKQNPLFNPNVDTDSDADNIQDYEDNCIDVFNPLQTDSDADGRGDKCSDIDNDGLVGNEDNCPNISNADQKDINLNKIGDVCEFDKDSDGIFDVVDNCMTTQNAHQRDSDNDGIGNLCDNCKYFNPKQTDQDDNKVGDVCDYKQKQLADNDDDTDGIINSKDNCPSIANSNQEDLDNDGIGDLCDNCKTVQNANQYDYNKNSIGDICEDSDSDGIEGLKDNCMNIVNPDQKDSDNDGIGDLCEDDDNDRIWFGNDNCPTDYNPFQKDVDGDGLGDKCDEEDSRTLESNKTLFIGLLILVTGLFGIGIYIMGKKIKTLSSVPEKKADKSGTKSNSKTKSKTKKPKLVKIGDELFESYTDRKKRESEK